MFKTYQRAKYEPTLRRAASPTSPVPPPPPPLGIVFFNSTSVTVTTSSLAGASSVATAASAGGDFATSTDLETNGMVFVLMAIELPMRRIARRPPSLRVVGWIMMVFSPSTTAYYYYLYLLMEADH